MASWRRGVEKEIPVELDSGLLEDIEGAWREAGREFQRSHLTALELEDAESRLRQLEMFDKDRSLSLLDVWKVGHGGPEFQLCLFFQETQREEATGGMSRTVLQYSGPMAGLFSLASDMGRVLMRRETWGDKLLEFFKSREVDFDESPVFSDRYYVLASDEEKLRKGFSADALDHLGTRRDLLIEIAGNDMVVLWPELIHEESAIMACRFFAEFAERLAPSSGPYR